MPKIYTYPANFGVSQSGDLENTTDGNPYTSHNGGNNTAFTFDFRGTQGISVDTVYVSGKNINSVAVSALSIAATNTVTTYDDRKAVLVTATSPVSLTSGTINITKDSGDAILYEVRFMRLLMDLSQNSERGITRFNVTTRMPSTYYIEDLGGTVTEQRYGSPYVKDTIAYTVWSRGANLTAARQKYNALKKLYYDNNQFTIFDLDEANAQDYESVYTAHFVAGSISPTIQGINAISYNFTCEQE